MQESSLVCQHKLFWWSCWSHWPQSHPVFGGTEAVKPIPASTMITVRRIYQPQIKNCEMKWRMRKEDFLTGHLLSELSSVTPRSASSKNFLALLICFFMKFLHLSVTLPAKMSSSVSPACANSSWGKYTLPLLALRSKVIFWEFKTFGSLQFKLHYSFETYSSPTSLSMFVSWLAIPNANAAL